VRIVIAVMALLCGIQAFGLAESSAADFQLKDGDRVVFLGNTLVERSQQYGYWETQLAASFPGAKVSFRNLGWDGDNVWAESRGIFDPPAKGYARMLDRVKSLKPTVIFLGYGGNEAFAGANGLLRFHEQYNRLMGDLEKVSEAGVRFVVLSPLQLEKLDPPLPDPQEVNEKLFVYNQVLKQLAADRNAPFVDFYNAFPGNKKLTTNGLHLTEAGYRNYSSILATQLGLKPVEWKQDSDSKLLNTLREETVHKNLLYFYSWRPQNITYLFLFRKHEQGNNAKEMKEFEELVFAKEKKIQGLLKSLQK